MKCANCGGLGYVIMHNQGCDGNCKRDCPIQEQCPDCFADEEKKPVRGGRVL